jgi:phospho-N-acetylmuramoyl-pentapeptide-transferase
MPVDYTEMLYGPLYADAFVAICGFVIVAVLGRPAIGLLRKLSFKQNAYEDAPKTHAVKTGTPTMGGLLFVLVLVVYALLTTLASIFGPHPSLAATAQFLALPGLGIACGAIGFVDDYASVLRGRNKGLGAREKFAATAVVAVAFLLVVGLVPGHVPTDSLSFGRAVFSVPVWLWYALGFVAILSTTHAVNLTDGLDGLASGTLIAPLILLVYLAWEAVSGFGKLGFFGSNAGGIDALVLGAVIGFLVYNKHPAKVFMGDTGSLLLGGILAGSAIMLDQQLLLPLIGGVFAAEALSVIIQVAYFKRTGKRIFRMSPLHHHFELAGWPETKVTMRFWTASVVLSLAGFATTFIPSAAS